MFDSSYTNQQNILHAWLKKAQQLQQKQKPKLVLVSCSGGGLRSATWTYTVLHHLDSLTNGNFFNQIHIISGTSGGSIGAALYREINLNAYQISYEKAFNMLSKDILNPLVYTFAVNDMFFR